MGALITLLLCISAALIASCDLAISIVASMAGVLYFWKPIFLNVFACLGIGLGLANSLAASDPVALGVLLLGSATVGGQTDLSRTTILGGLFASTIFGGILFRNGFTDFLMAPAAAFCFFFGKLIGASFGKHLALFVPLSLRPWAPLASLLIAYPYGFFQSGHRTIYLQNGVWASPSHPAKLESLNISTAYSYSLFAQELGAQVGGVGLLDESAAVAWLVTPTRPFTPSEAEQIQSWVKSGGRLIVVSEHTDVFGQARVLNELLVPMGIRFRLDALIGHSEPGAAWTKSHQLLELKTPCSIEGSDLNVIARMRGYREQADYSGKSFFGAMLPSGDDRYGLTVVAAEKAYGRGCVTAFGDSTLFANFCCFQPDNVKWRKFLSAKRPFTPFSKALPWVLLTITLIPRDSARTRRLAGICSGVLALSLPFVAFDTEREIDRQTPALWFSGDKSLVSEHSPPERSFSTAFSLAGLAGLRPAWSETPPIDESNVIWVGAQSPPSGKFKWLSPELPLEQRFDDGHPGFDSLYNALKAKPIGEWPPPDDRETKAGKIWTNDVMGDWWFDRGPSPSREHRFKSFLQWAQSKPIDPPNHPESHAGPKNYTWILRVNNVEGAEAIELPLPPKTDNSIGDFVYLGRGVSGQWTLTNDKWMIVGVKSFAEHWRFPDLWSLTPAEAPSQK